MPNKNAAVYVVRIFVSVPDQLINIQRGIFATGMVRCCNLGVNISNAVASSKNEQLSGPY